MKCVADFLLQANAFRVINIDLNRKIAQKKEEKPLQNCSLVLIGKLTKTGKELKDVIKELGGETSTKITSNTTCVISNQGKNLNLTLLGRFLPSF